MSSNFKNELKQSSWKRSTGFLVSFKNAFHGIIYSFNTQRNFKIHTFITFLVFLLGYYLKLPAHDLIALILVIIIVLSLELLNTSLEALVDLSIGDNYHPLAKIAKDCSAGAVLISSAGAVLIALLLFLEPLRINLSL